MSYEQVDTTGLQYALKTMGQEVLVPQFADSHPILDQCVKKKQAYGGRNNWELDLYSAPTPAVWARSENDTIDGAIAPSVTGVNVGKSTIYVPIKITGHMLRAQKLTTARIQEIVNFTQKDAKIALNRAVDRMLCGPGTGFIANLTTTSNSATVNVLLGTGEKFPVTLKDLAKAGGKIDIRNMTTGAAVVEGAVVSAYDETNATITIDSLVTTTTAHGICVKGNVKVVSSVATSLELDGIQKLVDSGTTYLGLDVSTYPWWASYELAMSAQGVDATTFQKMFDSIIDEAPSQPRICASGRGAIRNYFTQYLGDRRFNSKTLDTGVSVLTFTPLGGEEMNIISSRHMPDNEMYFLCPEHLIFFYTEMAQWRDYGGGQILHGMETEDAQVGMLILEGQFATDCRAAHGKLTGCAVA
jgi:hypothetical protein